MPFTYRDRSTEVKHRGMLSDYEIRVIQKFMKRHYLEMYEKWSEDSENGYFEKTDSFPIRM